MAVSQEEVLSKVQDVLVESLGLDDDEVTPDATLMGDLGAESIDILDISFGLEKAFNIKIPQGELVPPEEVLNNPEYVQDGMMTEAGIETLRTSMPFMDLTGFEDDPKVENIMERLTVQTIVNYVERKLAS